MFLYLQSPPKESIHLRQSKLLKIEGGIEKKLGVRHTYHWVGPNWTKPLFELSGGFGAPPTFHLAPPSVLSTRFDKSVYFLLGGTVSYTKKKSIHRCLNFLSECNKQFVSVITIIHLGKFLYQWGQDHSAISLAWVSLTPHLHCPSKDLLWNMNIMALWHYSV